MSQGLFVVFEGGDRCGKTTQLQLLVDHLQSNVSSIQTIRFPDRETETGQRINRCLCSKEEKESLSLEEMHCLFVENRKEKAELIRSKLQEGFVVLCDRYSYSGIAYSVAQGLPFDWCCRTEEQAHLPDPDVVLFMDLDPKIAAQRKGFGEEAFEKIELQQKVYSAFSEVRDYTLSRDGNEVRWFSIDASKTQEEMTNTIVNIIEQQLLLADFHS